MKITVRRAWLHFMRSRTYILLLRCTCFPLLHKALREIYFCSHGAEFICTAAAFNKDMDAAAAAIIVLMIYIRMV